MAFVRSKKVDGHAYYQLVKNERVVGKHKQRVLMHLGRHETVEAAIEAWTKRAGIDRSIAAHIRKQGHGGGLTARKCEARAKALEEKVEYLRLLSGD